MDTFAVVVGEFFDLALFPYAPTFCTYFRQALISGKNIEKIVEISQTFLTVPTGTFFNPVNIKILPNLLLDVYVSADPIPHQSGAIGLLTIPILVLLLLLFYFPLSLSLHFTILARLLRILNTTMLISHNLLLIIIPILL